jgi:hypothetical protein
MRCLPEDRQPADPEKKRAALKRGSGRIIPGVFRYGYRLFF